MLLYIAYNLNKIFLISIKENAQKSIKYVIVTENNI